MWDDLLAAIALLFVIEGIIPFASPQRLRRFLLQITQWDDRALRLMGLISMLAGVALLYALRGA